MSTSEYKRRLTCASDLECLIKCVRVGACKSVCKRCKRVIKVPRLKW